MQANTNSLDISRAVQHPFQDQTWINKILIGAVISIVPILNFATIGYMLEVLRNNAEGRDLPLPEWDNIGAKLVDGLKYVVISFVYALPIVLLICGLAVVGGGVASMLDGSGDLQDVAGAGISLLAVAVGCLAAVYGLFLGFLSPAIAIKYMRTRDIASCLRIGEILAIARRNTGQYLLAVVVVIAVSLALGLISGVIPFLGILIALAVSPYIQMLQGHLFGQYARMNGV